MSKIIDDLDDGGEGDHELDLDEDEIDPREGVVINQIHEQLSRALDEHVTREHVNAATLAFAEGVKKTGVESPLAKAALVILIAANAARIELSKVGLANLPVEIKTDVRAAAIIGFFDDCMVEAVETARNRPKRANRDIEIPAGKKADA